MALCISSSLYHTPTPPWLGSRILDQARVAAIRIELSYIYHMHVLKRLARLWKSGEIETYIFAYFDTLDGGLDPN
jgi:hypothetical protein